MITNKIKHPRYKDGRRFARRVHVHSANQMGTIFHTHAEDAARLCREGSAEPVEDQRKAKVISGIILRLIPGERSLKQKGTPEFTTRSYKGQKYVYLEKLGGDEFNGLTCYSFDERKLVSTPAYRDTL